MPPRFFVYFKKAFVWLFDFFSVSVCFKTLFSVWKRDLIDYQGLSITEILEAWTLNFASRFIGFLVKSINICVYLVVACCSLVFGAIFMVFWFFYPLAVAYLVIMAFRVIFGG